MSRSKSIGSKRARRERRERRSASVPAEVPAVAWRAGARVIPSRIEKGEAARRIAPSVTGSIVDTGVAGIGAAYPSGRRGPSSNAGIPNRDGRLRVPRACHRGGRSRRRPRSALGVGRLGSARDPARGSRTRVTHGDHARGSRTGITHWDPALGSRTGIPHANARPSGRFVQGISKSSTGDRDRTCKPLRAADFESAASANSATPARARSVAGGDGWRNPEADR